MLGPCVVGLATEDNLDVFLYFVFRVKLKWAAFIYLLALTLITTGRCVAFKYRGRVHRFDLVTLFGTNQPNDKGRYARIVRLQS